MPPESPPHGPGRWWRFLVLLAGLFLVGVGLMLVAAGQADDSPGLGGLGMVNALIGVVVAVRGGRGQVR